MGPCIGGVLVVVPFLWIMGYNPTHGYELDCSKKAADVFEPTDMDVLYSSEPKASTQAKAYQSGNAVDILNTLQTEWVLPQPKPLDDTGLVSAYRSLGKIMFSECRNYPSDSTFLAAQKL